MKLNIDILISREGLIVLSDIRDGFRWPVNASGSVKAEWHRQARELVDFGVLQAVDEKVCPYQLTGVGYAVLAASGG
jgi:hypothetical protein